MRSRLPAALCLSLALVAACGGGDDEPGGAGSASPSASPSPSEQPLTKAEATTIAKASQLRTGDLPGYQEDKAAAGPYERDETDAEIQRCITGTAEVPYLAEETSIDFAKGQPPQGVQVSSEAQVFPTREAAQAELTAYKQQETVDRLDTALGKLFAAEAEGAQVDGSLTTRQVTPPQGAQDAVGFTYTGTIGAGGVSVKFAAELTSLLVDRVAVTLSELEFGQALPEADRDRLLALLAERAAQAQEE